MANPVLIAKLALVAADPKTWQKIIIACISIFIISAALLGSCGAMTFTDLGFDCSQLFSAKLNEYSAVFDSGARINDKLLYAVYAKIFADNDRLKNQTDELIDCFVSDDKLSPLTDSDEIFDKIERTFDLKINAYMRSQLLRLAEQTRIVAFEYELSKDEYDKMRSKAVAAVKRSTGRISLFDTMQDSEE